MQRTAPRPVPQSGAIRIRPERGRKITHLFRGQAEEGCHCVDAHVTRAEKINCVLHNLRRTMQQICAIHSSGASIEAWRQWYSRSQILRLFQRFFEGERKAVSADIAFLICLKESEAKEADIINRIIHRKLKALQTKITRNKKTGRKWMSAVLAIVRLQNRFIQTGKLNLLKLKIMYIKFIDYSLNKITIDDEYI